MICECVITTTFVIHMYIFCTSAYVVENNAATVKAGQAVVVGEGVQVTIDCGSLIDDKISSGVQNPTVNWYKDGTKLTSGSAINVILSNDHRLCIISSTLLPVGGQAGTGGNYTCEACSGTTNCISQKSNLTVCGKKDLFKI